MRRHSRRLRRSRLRSGHRSDRAARASGANRFDADTNGAGMRAAVHVHVHDDGLCVPPRSAFPQPIAKAMAKGPASARVGVTPIYCKSRGFPSRGAFGRSKVAARTTMRDGGHQDWPRRTNHWHARMHALARARLLACAVRIGSRISHYFDDVTMASRPPLRAARRRPATYSNMNRRIECVLPKYGFAGASC
jgi:hypothetical protein